MKIVLNKRYGGFGLSEQGIRWLAEQGMEKAQEAIRTESLYEMHDIARNHPLLVKGVETMGSEFMSGPSSRLEVEESYTNGHIRDYDGRESQEMYGNTEVELIDPAEYIIREARRWLEKNTPDVQPEELDRLDAHLKSLI